MSSKISKKRSNTENLQEPKFSDQSPPKKQKKQAAKKPSEDQPAAISDGTPETLTASQRKRLKAKNRKLAAIARIKEEGGVPKSLWAGKKEKKGTGEKPGEPGVKKEGEKGEKNASVEAKLKAKQEKWAESKKLRQEKRLQDGQYKPEQVNLSADEIRLRIAEIKGRGELSKTAKRKLGVLLKKLAAEEGAPAGENEKKPQNGVEENSNLSKSEKRRLRREKQGKDEGEDSTERSDPSVEKPVDIQAFEKKKKQKTAVKNIGQNRKVAVSAKDVKNGGKQNKKQDLGKVENKAVKKTAVIEEPSESDDDEDEDEDEEEEEAESDDKVTGEESAEDEEDDEAEEDEKEDGDEEEDEDEKEDEEDEEDEEEEASEIPKVQIAQKDVKEKGAKGKKAQEQNMKKPLDNDQNSEKKKRYILFVGNMPFDSKPEDVKKHFLTKVSAVSSVRIPTRPGTQTPRGFGYVELTNEIDYEKGLSLHNTFLGGRKINVEYTAPGSKQISNKKDVVSKNQKLHAMRKAGKLAGSQKHDQKRSVRRFKKRDQERQPK